MKDKQETKFVAQFRLAAIGRGWLIAPVPDPKGSYQYQQYRPFDFVLITKNKVFCVEAKVERNPLISHQKGTAEALENVNPDAYWIIRKRTEQTGLYFSTWYSVEKFRNGNQTITTSKHISDILDFFER